MPLQGRRGFGGRLGGADFVHAEFFRSGGDGFVDGDFVDEVAEVAFGVAAVGVAAVFVFVGDLVHEFVNGAAFRGLFVEFELRSQAAQEFCCFEHDEEILSGEGEATNRTLVLGRNLRNICDIFAWWGVSEAVTGDW